MALDVTRRQNAAIAGLLRAELETDDAQSFSPRPA
jgi:hypothetical protein